MKEMSLSEIQIFSLEILKDVHTFCITNNIRYSLAYGTLLGAVRHEGFIPWDDDVDIIMPRPDYERFCKTYKSKKYKVYSPILNDCYLNYARVCDLNITWVLSLPWCKDSPTGLWIDIFPIDGIDSMCDRYSEKANLEMLKKSEMIARNPMNNLSRPMPFSRLWRSIVMKVLFFWTNIHKLVEEYEKCIKTNDFELSHLCGNKSILTYYNKEKYPSSWFDKYVDLKFEGCTLKAISEYHYYLKNIYGDYMKLPPEEKRISHPQKMYWKNEKTK